MIESLPPRGGPAPGGDPNRHQREGGAFEGYQLEGKLRGRVDVELRDWEVGRYEPEELELVGGRPAFVCREAYAPLERRGDRGDRRPPEHRA